MPEHNPWSDFDLRTGQVRLDLFGAFAYEAPDDEAAMRLFWWVYKPRAITLKPEGKSVALSLNVADLKPTALTEPAPMPKDVASRFLDRLANLERAARVQYEPDQTDSWRGFPHLHLATAYAWALWRSDGLSEEVTATLERALQTSKRLGVNPYLGWTEAPSTIVSIWAVTGLATMLLAQAKIVEGKHEDAIRLLRDGLKCFTAAFISKSQPAEELGIEESGVEDEKQWRREFDQCLQLPELDWQRYVDAFEHLRADGRSEHWADIADDCTKIAKIWERLDFEAARALKVLPQSGIPCSWSEFWYRVSGIAKEHLSHDQLLALIRRADEADAEERLIGYFFKPDMWHKLPVQARKAIIDADRTYLRTSAGRREAVLNHLRIAAESLCFELFGSSLDIPVGSPSSWSPNLGDYARFLRQPLVASMSALLKLDKPDMEFLATEAASAMQRLWQDRNPAEHQPRYRATDDIVRSHFERFLGVGCAGILPRLAAVLVGSKQRQGRTVAP